MSDYRFEIPPCSYAVVSAVGLQEDDEVRLWRLACTEGCPEGYVYIPYDPNPCDTRQPPCCANPMVIRLPGTYEARWESLENDDVQFCHQIYPLNCGGV